MKTKVHYAVEDHGMTFEDSWSIDTVWDLDDALDYIAEECAENYHSEHDGWESHWPVTFVMWDAQGKELGTCEVYRDAEPVFRAAWKTLKKNQDLIKE
jgi:hypothetical protein